LVVPPVSVALKFTVFAVPEGTVTGAEGEVIVTTGAGVIVTVEVANTFGSSDEATDTLTMLGEGIVVGAWYCPWESIIPTVSLPPAIPFTCQIG
jgi:hypothetical protein